MLNALYNLMVVRNVTSFLSFAKVMQCVEYRARNSKL